MCRSRRSLLVVLLVAVAFAVLLPVGAAAANGAPASPTKTSTGTAATKTRAPTPCQTALGNAPVTGPTNTVAWRAGVESRVAVFDRLPGKRLRQSRWAAPSNAPWLLVVSRPRVDQHRCFVDVRLPWRPNDAAAWINVNNVVIQKTPWRIAVSRAHRTLTVFKAGRSVRTVRVVVGKPSTPTPTGLFAVAWAIPWHPNDFLGSWVLELTAHSNVLKQFDGGDGTVGLHGRGGASLLDPLGSARSHGCVRLANGSIDWLVRTIGQNRLPGTPVRIS